MADPWFSYPPLGISVGPMTLTDDQRKKAADAYARQQGLYQQSIMQQRKDFDQSVDPATGRVAPVLTPAQQAVSAETQPAVAAPNTVNPNQDAGGGGIWDWLSKTFPETTKLLSGTPDAQVQGPPASAKQAPVTYPIDPGIITASQPSARGAAQVAAAGDAATKTVDPIQQNIDMLSKYFGDPNAANPKQDKADAYAERENKRTALLAQLAFAAGLTKAGGKQWEGIGQGFADAAGVYDKGFQRYQNALQDSADRYAKTNDTKENRKLAITKAAIDLTQTQAELQRKTWADIQDRLDKQYGGELTAAKTDIAGVDDNKVADIMKRWQRASQAGEYLPPTIDVSDK